MPELLYPLRHEVPDPSLAVCCFCGCRQTTFHRNAPKEAWREVTRDGLFGQEGGQRHPLLPQITASAGQAVELRRCRKRRGCPKAPGDPLPSGAQQDQHLHCCLQQSHVKKSQVLVKWEAIGPAP